MSTAAKKVRTGNISQEQKEALVEFMERNVKLKTGKFDNTFTFKDAQNLWINIGNTLNSIPGAKKDWRHWRKTWQDLRTKTKSKHSQIKKHREQTGGGETIKEHLNPLEERILETVGNTSILGHRDCQESLVSINITDEGLEIPEVTEEIWVNEEDHNYSTNLETEVMQNDQESNLQIIEEADTDTIIESRQNIAANTNKGRPKRAQILENTVNATNRLADECKTKTHIKKKYYDQKLELMREDILVKKQIASALEKIAGKL